jgi:Zn-dependent M16 (insulinase) family peptidase
MDIKVGTRLHDFVVRRVTPVELMNSLAIELEHEGTGLRLLHVKNDDSENLFSITFPTPPPDDTGVPHILEHSVLAGSRKYPAREGFFELTKRSLGTFINAMTADEHTLYPVASVVPKDLFNLADVYWDAVFSPLLTEHTFRREGHRLELANPQDTASELVIRGIVYSEMQGGYSSAESLIYRTLDQGLFPDTPYGRDAGGDPAAIPALTYQGLRDFHARHYHPGQALVVVYGNLPTETYASFVAERLGGVRSRAPAVTLGRQPRWSAPRRQHMTCPVGLNEAGRAWLVLGWICGDGTDPVDAMRLGILQGVLVGHPGAVLRKAILDAKLGDDLALTTLNPKRLDTTLSVGVRGAAARRADEFVELVLHHLAELAERGIPRDAIQTAAQQLAYSTLQIDDQFPVHLLWKLSTQYVLTGDPFIVLRPAEHLRVARERALANPADLTELLRERLLHNPHRLLIVAEGDPEHARKHDQAVKEELRARKAAMSTPEVSRLVADAEEFERLEQERDVEAFERLPQLGISDLPTRPRTIPTVLEAEPRFEFLSNQVFSNGINYLHLDLDLSHVASELLAYVGLYGQCLGRLGTRGRPWAETAARVAACTSGVSGWAQLNAHGNDPSHTVRSLRLATSFLDGRAEEALAVLEDLAFALDFDDRTRLGEILVQARARQRAHIAGRASELGRSKAARPLGPETWLSDEGHGLAQLRLIERLAAGFDSGETAIIDQSVDRLKRLAAAFARTRRLAASFTGAPSEKPRVRSRLQSWTEHEPPGCAEPVGWMRETLPRAVGLAAPMDVGYCSYVVPGPHYADEQEAALEVAATYYRQHYLLEEVRLRGAAYGAWCHPHPLHRHLTLGSYRDPGIARTVGVFRRAVEGVGRLAWSDGDVERAVLVTAKDSLRPNRPAEATGSALFWHVHGLTDELRLERYQAILSVRPEVARQTLLEVLEGGARQASICVVSSRERLEAANQELGHAGLELEEVFP